MTKPKRDDEWTEADTATAEVSGTEETDTAAPAPDEAAELAADDDPRDPRRDPGDYAR